MRGGHGGTKRAFQSKRSLGDSSMSKGEGGKSDMGQDKGGEGVLHDGAKEEQKGRRLDLVLEKINRDRGTVRRTFLEEYVHNDRKGSYQGYLHARMFSSSMRENQYSDLTA